jgi:ribosomal protein S20
MVKQIEELFEKIDKSNADQEMNEAYEHIYTLVSKKYLSYIQCVRTLHATESDPPTGLKSSPL